MTRLVLLRHGRTTFNHEGRVQGQLDAPLDDVGRAQAVAVAPAMAGLGPSLLWCSDLGRARDTAAPVASTTGLVPAYDARLREFYFGEREGLTHAQYEALDPAAYAAFRGGDYDRTPGAEPTVEVRARMAEVLGELLAALGPDGTGIAVSHGAAIRVAVGTLLGWPDDQFHTLRGLDNTGWVVIEGDPAAGPLRLSGYNRVV